MSSFISKFLSRIDEFFFYQDAQQYRNLYSKEKLANSQLHQAIKSLGTQLKQQEFKLFRLERNLHLLQPNKEIKEPRHNQ